MQTPTISLKTAFVPSGGTIDETPIFLLSPTVCDLVFMCANFKIVLRLDGTDQLNRSLDVRVARTDNLVKALGHLVVPLTAPLYLTEALPPATKKNSPRATTFVEDISVNADLEPTFRLQPDVEDFYFEMECGYAIDILCVDDMLTISVMAPYNAETEMTEVAGQLILDLE